MFTFIQAADIRACGHAGAVCAPRRSTRVVVTITGGRGPGSSVQNIEHYKQQKQERDKLYNPAVDCA